MKHKTAELEGALLDAAVAKAEGGELVFGEKYGWRTKLLPQFSGFHALLPWSTDWEHGGPIIERERINVVSVRPGDWAASPKDQTYSGRQEGPTPLIAAMRAYVASKLGEEVEL